MGLTHPILGIQILFQHPHGNHDLLLNLFNFDKISIVIQIRQEYLLRIEYLKGCRTCYGMFHLFILFKIGLIIHPIINH